MRDELPRRDGDDDGGRRRKNANTPPTRQALVNPLLHRRKRSADMESPVALGFVGLFGALSFVITKPRARATAAKPGSGIVRLQDFDLRGELVHARE